MNDERETPTPNRLVYTPREAAELLGVDRSTVYRRIREGAIPVVKMGTGRMFIPKKPLDEMFSGSRGVDDISGGG